MPATFFAEVIAARLTSGTGTAGQRAVHHDLLPRLEACDAFADSGDFAGGFCADHERQLALGESHAAIAPHVDMIEGDRLDADLHFARAGRRGRWCVRDHELAVGNEGERAHQGVLKG